MDKRKSGELKFECEFDGTPMWVSFSNDGVVFGINDDDNDQGKQVRLCREDLRILASRIMEYLK